jgi:hypothetical protein
LDYFVSCGGVFQENDDNWLCAAAESSLSKPRFDPTSDVNIFNYYYNCDY